MFAHVVEPHQEVGVAQVEGRDVLVSQGAVFGNVLQHGHGHVATLLQNVFV